jgi:hypothetical protein
MPLFLQWLYARGKLQLELHDVLKLYKAGRLEL